MYYAGYENAGVDVVDITTARAGLPLLVITGRYLHFKLMAALIAIGHFRSLHTLLNTRTENSGGGLANRLCFACDVYCLGRY